MSSRETANQSKLNYCIKCGIPLPDGAVFCGNCGYKLYEQATSVVKVQVPKQKPSIERELRLHHILFTVFFGLFYAVPMSILFLTANNTRAAKVIAVGGTFSSLISILLYFTLF